MSLWRVLPWERGARPGAPGGALWFPRPFQGAGRHDNPDRYGCLYLAEDAVASVAEALAPFRGSGARAGELLVRSGRPLALVRLRWSGVATLIDLDDPAVLVRGELRPSQVATGHRSFTQRIAADLHEGFPRACGLRWWSTLEASWTNVTVFDRASRRLAVDEVRLLSAADAELKDAAVFLGLR